MTATKPVIEADLKRIEAIATNLNAAVKELEALFPGRSHVIQQMVLALMTREHVLIYGLPGSGKSKLVQTLFNMFTGANLYQIALTKFMTESNIFGVPNPKKLRDEGVIEYDEDSGVLKAEFVEFDEFFDGNDALLRTLLGLMNEREYKRGNQIKKAAMHTAIASTNSTPEAEARRFQGLSAVIDRFLFHSVVSYLDAQTDRMAMYLAHLEGVQPTVSLPYSELEWISGIVAGSNQITDHRFIQIFDEVVQAWEKAAKQNPSDRRVCQLLQICEATALMHGRYAVELPDILSIRWGLCTGGRQEEFDKFMKVAEPILQKAEKEAPQSVDEVQLQLLEVCQRQIPAKIPANSDPNQLVTYRRELTALEQEVKKVRPKLETTTKIQTQILATIAQRIQEVDRQINKV